MNNIITTGQTLFVAGTDTDVGKTYISAALVAQALQQSKGPVTYYKPIQTGVSTNSDSDAHTVQKVAEAYQQTSTQLICGTGYSFETPASPLVADEKKEIRIDKIRTDIQECQNRNYDGKNTVILESAGGLLVPLIEDWLMIDLIKRLGVSVVLVTTPKLGTLNHTLLSVEALQKRLINIQAIVINRISIESNTKAETTMPEVLRQYLDEDIPIYYSLESKKPAGPNSIIDNIENFLEIIHA